MGASIQGPVLRLDECLAVVAKAIPGFRLGFCFQVQYRGRRNFTRGPRILKAVSPFRFLSFVTLDFKVLVCVECPVLRAGPRLVARLSLIIQPTVPFNRRLGSGRSRRLLLRKYRRNWRYISSCNEVAVRVGRDYLAYFP
jgi:hypothetical protein